jgi:hypothetical protein
VRHHHCRRRYARADRLDVIPAALGAMLVLCLLSSLVACSEETPNRGHGQPEPRRSPTVITTPERSTKEASRPSGSHAVEYTVGGAILRRDEDVLGIDRAELLRSKEKDEIFVTATVKGPAEAKDCYLMKGSTWFALRDAIESENASDAPAVLEASWADPASTTSFSGSDTLAVSFQEYTDGKDKGPDPRDAPFFAVCYKFASTTGDGTDNATWFDVAHVEGTPEPP